MATTPNYGFIMPDPTDFVTDLPADFEIFGDEVDLRVKALNPETTEGDLAYRGATADAKVRLGIGTAGQVLTVNSGATAPEWGTVSAGGMTLISTTTFASTGTTTLSSIPQTFKHLYLVFQDIRMSTNNSGIYIDQLGGNNTSATWVGRAFNGTTFNTQQVNLSTFGISSGASLFAVAHGPSTTVTRELGFADCLFPNYTGAQAKFGFSKAAWVDGSSGNWRSSEIWANTGLNGAITSIRLQPAVNITSGSLLLFGVS